ncbi:PKD domain-containing protein [Mucilaginibacter terrae]|uniref:PKD domain-containing protein n=1 Tax=Mucilaginibacter terrae TaxID=1955052 RepID=UPI003633F1F2
MVRLFTRFVVGTLLLLCSVLAGTEAFAQTITIRNVDAGPYGQGSSIAATIAVDESAGRIGLTNRYDLYLSDANGNFASQTLIGSFTGFYTGFVNGILPAGIAAGTGYRIRVQSTAPAVVSAPSVPFTVNAFTGVKAVAASPNTSSASAEVFGTCVGENGNRFSLNSTLSNTHTVTANLYNDMSRQNEGGTIVIDPIGQTPALSASSYTVTVKAVNSNGIVGTKAYLLINNKVLINFGSENSGAKCLQDGQAEVNFNVDITTVRSIEANYPGSRYTATWGDGTSQDYTFAQIKATGGQLAHTFNKSSCGAKNAQGNVTNQFMVKFSVVNPFCPPPSAADNPYSFTTNQAVLLPPKNSISGPAKICLNTEATFTNTSDPGQSATPGTNNAGCKFNDASYTWYVDGAPKAIGKKLTEKFKWTFTTRGPHTVSIELENSQSECTPPIFSLPVCVQEAPKPEFTIADVACTGSGAVIPLDQSVLDNICSDNYTYKWTVTPATGFTYANGTNAASKAPQFVFSTPGNYAVYLEISNSSCGSFKSTTKPIVVTGTPVATLSADFSLCGKGQTLTFDNTAGSLTRTTLTGTVTPKTDTYQWTVTGQNGIGAATFVNNTTANSQYPQILFPDFGTYEVTVKHINDCGTTTSQVQQITLKQAPTVKAGDDQIICSGAVAQLDGSVAGVFNTMVWSTSGTGTFSDKNIEKPVYTPSAADRTAGQVKLTFTVTTSLPGDCKNITDEVIININPTNTVTTASTKNVCTGSPVAYVPASTVAGSTFNWVVTLSSPNASGFTTSGSGDINDVLTNSSANTNATVIYTITPQANGCNGTPFTLTVTVAPKPVLTVTGPTNNSVCSGSAAGVQLTSTVTGTQYTWSVNVTGGVTGATDQTTPVAANAINQVLVNNSSSVATVTYTVTPVNPNSADVCAGDVKTITLTVQPQVPVALAGNDAVLCCQSTYQLQGNDAGNFTGTWTLTSGQAGVSFADASKFNTSVSGLQAGQSYTFKWTISGAAQCTVQSDDVTIVNNPDIGNNTVTLVSPTTCAGQTIIVTGSTPTGGGGTYTYVWESSVDGNNWTVLSSQTNKDLTINVVESTFFRRVVASGACTEAKSNAVRAIVQPAISGNSIALLNLSVCVNKDAGTITGSTPAGADGNYNYQWQSSTDGGNNWANITGATNINYATPVLIGNIQYRRVVSSLLCTGIQSNYSNVISITVNPDAKAEFTWTKDADCVPFALSTQNIKAVPYPNRNADYTWYANNQVIGTGITFPGYTINTDGETVEIRLIAKSISGCESSVFTHIFTTTKSVKASYTQSVTQNCGTVTVTFTNTSDPLASGNYHWEFGNGITSNKVQPDPVTFVAATDGRDITYNVKLTATTSCSNTEMATTVLIKPVTPIARIAPKATTGCAPFALVIDNISPGTNDKYIYHVLDASGVDAITPLVVTNKSQQTITIPNEGEYSVYMEAQTVCGTGKSANIPIQVTARTLFAGITTSTTAERFGCAPHVVNFNNTSQGGITYRIDWKDGTPITTTNNTGALIHTFTKAGRYDVVLYASNDCAQDVASQIVTIIVSDKPAPAFTMDNGAGCKILTVNFVNTTPNPVNGTADDYTYSWNFGDVRSANNTSTSRTPAHTFDYVSSPYTITLTVTNRNSGCSETVTRIVTVSAPSVSEFRARPDSVQTFPNYQFSFEDLSTNSPKTWRWNFGDGSMSMQQHPTHTYADTGFYKVTLTTTNGSCGTTKIHYVRITGTPGQLYVPNAFTPSSTNQDLRIFAAKGSGLRQWHMRIYNNYGQLVWETTKLDARGEPVDGWDGTFQGTPVPQGVYIWQIDASFINGAEWKGMSYNSSSPKRTGAIHLIK